MERLNRRTFSESPKFDFGCDAYVERVSFQRSHNQEIELTLMIRSRDCINTVVCSRPANIEQIGLVLDACSVKIFDLNESDGFHRDFGRYLVEFSDDDDFNPLVLSVDNIQVTGVQV